MEASVPLMFDAIRKRLAQLQAAPQRAREIAAQRLTDDMPKGHAVATGDGVAVFANVRRPYVGEKWQGIILQAIRDAGEGR